MTLQRYDFVQGPSWSMFQLFIGHGHGRDSLNSLRERTRARGLSVEGARRRVVDDAARFGSLVGGSPNRCLQKIKATRHDWA